MNKEEKDIREIFIEVVENIKKLENDLFDNGKEIHEVTIVSKIAHHIQNRLDRDNLDYKCDIEYNRYRDELEKDFSKNIRINNESKDVRPDLIIHKRHTDNNILIAEFKHNKNSIEDQNKLKEMTIKYNYKAAYFVNLNTNIMKLKPAIKEININEITV